VSGSSSSAAQALLVGGSNDGGGYDTEASVVLRIYTRSGRLLWTHRIQGVKRGNNSYHWAGRDFKNALLANGLYFYTATLEKNGVTRIKTSAIFILK
jgi:flagellar hook assembly protein FlgD